MVLPLCHYECWDFSFVFFLAFLLTPTFPCSSSIIFPDSLLLHIYICFSARKYTNSSSRRARDWISIKELQSCIQTSRIITQKDFSLCFSPQTNFNLFTTTHIFIITPVLDFYCKKMFKSFISIQIIANNVQQNVY